jgi:polyisoprenoid-binding protein YceI
MAKPSINIIAAAVAAILARASPAWAEPAASVRDPAAVPAGAYVLDPRHASLTARVSHMGLSDYTMRFDRLDAHFDYDPTQPLATKLVVDVDPASLDVGDAAIGKRFAAEFLDAGGAPQITFTSTAITLTDQTHGTVTGDLAFHGEVHPVTLAVTFNGYGASLIGGRRMGFSAIADIKRSDFGSKAWLSEVGDTVHLVIEAEFTRR